MDERTSPSSDVAFSAAVKELQRKNGSRTAYARMEARGGFHGELDDDVRDYIAAQRSFFLATASKDGQPYVQHRGGPPGFLTVLDAHTLAFADFSGNRQYISAGNLSENPKVQLFLIDYAQRTRVKIWGTAELVKGDPTLLAALTPTDYKAHPERVVRIHVSAWDANCPQHIPQRFEAEDVARALAQRDAEIAERDAQIAELKRALAQRSQ